ncbi:MAG: sulfatase-like hydrolase/transferase [Imperialibacter sp.]|uniref:sulfatase-like hydrolase/transferase n=1 Tax=Imperialibacter sp. TaxID=2038411 RepID=UPI003A88C072
MKEFKKSTVLQVLIINWCGIGLILIIFRVYALIGIGLMHYTSVAAMTLTFARGLASDLITALCLALLFSPLLLLLRLVIPKRPLVWLLPPYLFVAILSFGLERYFISEMTPIGADFWNYSGDDIRTTIAASVHFDAILGLGLFVLALSLCCSAFLSQRALENFGKRYYSFSLSALGLSVLVSFFVPDFASLQNQYLAENRMSYFALHSFAGVSAANTPSTVVIEAYPFERPFEETDILGPHFKEFDVPPNLIFIQVEGLGGAITGKEAKMKGFTPFLDSLSEASLFWPNCLSTTGRTFGVVPALYGSLPPGNQGFMDLGPDYPSHFTLISWLKGNGYSTSYYYGGNINFDKTDIFLDYQGIDNLIYEGRFPDSYKKMEANNEGFSWGYPDGALFDFYEKSISTVSSPRMDMLMTLTTHEPFRVPESGVYSKKFDSVVAGFDKKELFLAYRNIFETFLYFDDGLRILFHKLSKRADWENTIVVITGDHRVIPLPQESPLDRFHVPLLIFSPALLRGQTFKAMASHTQVAPSFVSFFKSKYRFPVENKLPFVSGSLPQQTDFEARLSLPLMRNKGELDIFIDNNILLANDRLFEVGEGLAIEPLNDAEKKASLKTKLNLFKQKQEVALQENRLWEYKSGQSNQQFTFSDTALQWIKDMGVKQMGSDSQFYFARELAHNKEYERARWAAGYLLNNSPNYSDARILIGRTFAWEGQYSQATPILQEAQRRSPNYEDVYQALADVYFWSEQTDSSRLWVDKGLERFPKSVQLQQKRKRLEE